METCEGYKNYPTFVVANDIANDRGSYDYWHNLAAEYLAAAVSEGVFTRSDVALIRLSETLKENHEGAAEWANAEGVLSSLLGYALGCVDWYEIATELADDVTENPGVYGAVTQ